jgi:predicted nucleic acid-binding protein
MIVADTNLWLYRLIESEMTAQAMRVWKKDNDWKTTRLCLYEIVNVLCTYQRVGKLTVSQCEELLQRQSLQIEPAIQEVDLSLTLQLAAQYRVSGYDAQYLALTRMLKVPLITEDRKLRRAAPDLTLSMQAFLAQ